MGKILKYNFKKFIKKRTSYPISLAEIARKLGISRQAVWQREKKKGKL